jgi:signal transduction histidine kinase/HPt (histidine-containing phosphotransfer) domain-containing protein/ActR/RegA family two-component response regulator
VLGYTREELLALKVEAICFPEDQAQVRKSLQEQGEAAFRGYRRNRQGLKIPFEVKAKKIVYKDAHCILTVARDITTVREAEEVIRKQNLSLEEMVAQRTAELSAAMAELENARQAAESANLSKSQFLANMSHEIRTPINGVLGTIDLLLNTGVTDQQRRFLENARDSGNILLILINDILDISRIEASQLTLENIPFHLSKLVGEIIELTAREAQAKGLAIHCRISPPTPYRLKGDPVRLSQILLNLLGNAIKFTPTGEIIVRVTCVQEHSETAEIRVEVQDTGIGISPEVQSLIFEPFRQGDGSMTRKFGGTGLGLAIVKHLVLLMGGEVGIDSQPARGSTFWFSIPFAKDPHVETDTLAPKDGRPPSLPTLVQGQSLVDSSARILLAEDNLVNQEIASAMLAHIGCLVDVVSDGLQALDALTRNRYDLVFMDCQMPELDGYEATRAIRAEEALSTPASRLPIIALTAHAMAGDRDLCLAAGMDDYLSKPFTKVQLQKILAKWLVAHPLPDPLTTGPGPASAEGSEEPSATQPLDVKVLNAIRSLQQEGTPDLLGAVIRTYMSEAPHLLEKLSAAVRQGNSSVTYQTAHSLKSSSANVGALTLAELLSQLEAMAKESSLDQAPTVLAHIAREYERVRTALQFEVSG